MSDEQKKFIVTSYNQQGGITAGSVNFGPQARQMNSELGNQLKSALKTSHQIRIVAVLGDGEAFGFANQILNWLKANGFNNVDGVDQAVYTVPMMGQIINQKSENNYEIIIGTRQ